MVNQEFLEVDEEESSEAESRLKPKFEKMKLELLGCIFQTLSKAIEIREKNEGKYRLGRMADVLEWCEAISQASWL